MNIWQRHKKRLGICFDSSSIHCFCKRVTNESSKREAINFINQQSQTPAGLSCKINRDLEQWRTLSLSGKILITRAFLPHMFAFLCVTAWRTAVTCMQMSPVDRHSAKHRCQGLVGFSMIGWISTYKTGNTGFGCSFTTCKNERILIRFRHLKK